MQYVSVDIWGWVCRRLECNVGIMIVYSESGVRTEYEDRTGYNGSAIVERSIQIGEPIIFVALNYR